MKWKDTGESNGDNPDAGHSYYEDDGYPSIKGNHPKKSAFFSGMPLRTVFWGIGIAVVIFFILELGSILNGQNDESRIAALEMKIEQLENRLQKIDGVDEKVTRIWEQAKSFETFKTRFDRSEASMSLRMDHLAMSLDALQKKSNETIERLGSLEKKALHRQPARKQAPVRPQAKNKTHTVVKGETLYSISRKYNLELETLRSMNKLSKEAVIHVGQVLVVRSAAN